MNYLYYDGECPFCHKYVTLVRIRQSVGKIDIVNVREKEALAKQFKQQGFDLNEGMLLVLDEKYYYGPDCVFMLSMISSDTNAFNRFNGWFFRSKARARVFYPILKLGRRLVLFLLRIKPI